MSATTQAQTAPRLLRDQCHLFFDPNEPPRIRVGSGTGLVVETEDAHMGSIRTEQDIYPTLANVFERLGGANPVTGPIYVEGVKPGDCVSVTILDIVPGPVQGQGRDLPVALVETCTAFGIEPRDASPQHRDFKRIDGVLAKTEALVKNRFITGDLAEVDGALGHLDDCVAMWSVERAREAAWTNAQALWALRGVPHLSARFLLTLDRMVGFAGRGLLCPLATGTSVA